MHNLVQVGSSDGISLKMCALRYLRGGVSLKHYSLGCVRSRNIFTLSLPLLTIPGPLSQQILIHCLLGARQGPGSVGNITREAHMCPPPKACWGKKNQTLLSGLCISKASPRVPQEQATSKLSLSGGSGKAP